MRRDGDRCDRSKLAEAAWPFVVMGLVLATACQEPNPDFDGPAESSNASSTSSTTGGGPDTGPELTTGPVVTGDGTSGSTTAGTTDTPPSTTTGEPPGTSSSSGEPAEGSTTGCMGMICDGECVDVMTDDDHCGMCNEKCVGQQECIDGECMMK